MLLAPWNQKQVAPLILFWERTPRIWPTAPLGCPVSLSAFIEADWKVVHKMLIIVTLIQGRDNVLTGGTSNIWQERAAAGADG